MLASSFNFIPFTLKGDTKKKKNRRRNNLHGWSQSPLRQTADDVFGVPADYKHGHVPRSTIHGPEQNNLFAVGLSTASARPRKKPHKSPTTNPRPVRILSLRLLSCRSGQISVRTVDGSDRPHLSNSATAVIFASHHTHADAGLPLAQRDDNNRSHWHAIMSLVETLALTLLDHIYLFSHCAQHQVPQQTPKPQEP